MPNLGIIASSKSGNLSVPISGAYDSIAAYTIPATSVQAITFNAIPQTYSHLQFRISARSTYAGTGDGYLLTFNGVGGTSYAYHLNIGTGASATTGQNTGAAFIAFGDVPAATETANVFGSVIVDVLDYSNVNKNKTTRSLSADDRNGSGSIRFNSGLFMSTNAITSATITLLNSGSFAQYSSLALYGIKG